MKIVKIILLLAFLLIIVFVIHLLVTTGYFRKINNEFDGIVLKEISIKGAEDMCLSSSDSFLIISSTDRKGQREKNPVQGALYFMELKSGNFVLKNLTETFDKSFAPHGISMFKSDSTYTIMAINHSKNGQSIEVFTLHGNELVHKKTLSDPSMISPNDLVMLDENRFYFTNDHGFTKGIGRFLEDYGGLPLSNVVYYDGQNYNTVASRIAYANGINFDAKRNLLFVASPRNFLVKVFSPKKDGTLEFIENIPCGTGVDNIEFDNDANLWIGSHPNLLTFAAYAQGKKNYSPSELIKIIYRGKNDFSVTKIFEDDGEKMSASTVAIPFGNLIFTGNVMDDKFLILKRGK